MSESEAWSETQTIHTNDCTTLGNGYSSVVRAAESSWKGRSFESLQERRGEFSSPGSTFCADSHFGIRSTPVLTQ